MRRYASILLAVVLMVSIGRPLLPHLLFQLNKSHIQSALCEQRDDVRNCCKGSCFLRKQLRQAEPDRGGDMVTVAVAVHLDQGMPEEADLNIGLESSLLPWLLSGDEALTDESYLESPTPPPWKPLLG